MIVECSRVKTHPKAESRQIALKKGWYQDKNAEWVCPKCQRSVEGAAQMLEGQRLQERGRKHKKGGKQRGKVRILNPGADLAVSLGDPAD